MSKTIWYQIYYQDKNLCILQTHGIQPEIYKLLKDNVFVLISFSWVLESDKLQELIKFFPKGYNTKKYVYLLVNSQDEFDMANGFSDLFNIVLWNNACRILEKNFLIPDLKLYKMKPREFKCVMNSRLTKFKKHYLTYNIDNIAYITMTDKDPQKSLCNCSSNVICDQCAFTPIELKTVECSKSPSSKIYTNINANKICEILDKSDMGIILSPYEGACYSSLEYLCRGLPVISTKATGGRMSFYNNFNSIICEDNENSLKDAINTCLIKLDNNEFNRKKIREDAIKKIIYFRNVFISITDEIFEMYNINIVAKNYFNDKLDDFTFYQIYSNISQHLDIIKSAINNIV